MPTEEETTKAFEEQLKKSIDETMEKALPSILEKEVGKTVAVEAGKQIKNIIRQLRAEQAISGKDRTGVSEEQKAAFVLQLQKACRVPVSKHLEDIVSKAQTLETTESGGLLVPTEVYAGVMRLAEDFGYIMSMAQKFPMGGIGELTIPKYTQESTEWQYLGESEEGDENTFSLGSATLTIKQAIRLYGVDRRLITKGAVSIADWIMTLLAQSLAYTIDKQGFVGTGSPFVGLLNDTRVATITMNSGDTDFGDIGYEYLSAMVAATPKSLRNSAFFFHKTVIHKLRTEKDSVGQYIWKDNTTVLTNDGGSPMLRPEGFVLGRPVYSIDVLPELADSAVSTVFGVYGDLSYFFMGDGGSMEVASSENATINGRSMFASNQVAYRGLHEHALTVGLETAFVKIRTAAS